MGDILQAFSRTFFWVKTFAFSSNFTEISSKGSYEQGFSIGLSKGLLFVCHQVVSWSSVDPDLQCHMPSTGHAIMTIRSITYCPITRWAQVIENVMWSSRKFDFKTSNCNGKIRLIKMAHAQNRHEKFGYKCWQVVYLNFRSAIY